MNIKILLYLLIFTFTLSGCVSHSQNTTEPDNQQKSVMDTKGENTVKKNIEDFKFLKVGMKKKEILKKLGEPKEEIGSGIDIYVYELKDGTNVQLCFYSDDTLNKVLLVVDKNESKIILE